MRIKNLNNTGFTLLEILLAAIIFVITVAGLFATLNAVRRPVIDKESALDASNFGKQVLESLRSKVDASTYYNPCVAVNPDNTCGDFSLSLGNHEVPQGNLPQDLGQSWQSSVLPGSNPNGVSYAVSCADTGSLVTCGADTARQVKLNIQWPDSS